MTRKRRLLKRHFLSDWKFLVNCYLPKIGITSCCSILHDFFILTEEASNIRRAPNEGARPKHALFIELSKKCERQFESDTPN